MWIWDRRCSLLGGGGEPRQVLLCKVVAHSLVIFSRAKKAIGAKQSSAIVLQQPNLLMVELLPSLFITLHSFPLLTGWAFK